MPQTSTTDPDLENVVDDATFDREIATRMPELLQLSSPIRLEIAQQLLNSVPAFGDPVIRQSWSNEIGRRIAELESGAVEAVPVEEALDRIRERLNEANQDAS